MSWIRSPRANPTADCRFVVFHHAGGMGNAYFQWHSQLPPEAELLIVDLPGRAMSAQEKRIVNFEQLMEKLIPELTPFLDRPFILFGHSLGALIVYELAKKLPEVQLRLLKGIVLSAFKPPTEKNVNSHPILSHLDDETFIQKMNEIAPLPQEITGHAETLAYFLTLIRSDLKIIESYSANHRQCVNVKAIVLGGEQDLQISTTALEDWRQLVAVQGEVRIFPGGHFFIFQNAPSILREVFKTFL